MGGVVLLASINTHAVHLSPILPYVREGESYSVQCSYDKNLRIMTQETVSWLLEFPQL